MSISSFDLKNFYDSVYQWEFFEVASFNTGFYGGHNYERAPFRHTTKKMACSQIAIIYSFFSNFWSVYVLCKTFFRRKSTNILARSLRSLDIIFLKFLVSNEQDHIMSVTNTVMDLLYRQTVINQQCIY